MRIIIFSIATIHIAARAVLIEINGKAGRTCWIGFALETPEGKSILKLAETDIPVAPIVPKSFPSAVSRKPPRIDWIS
jgi:hypothetical protein